MTGNGWLHHLNLVASAVIAVIYDSIFSMSCDAAQAVDVTSCTGG